MSNDVNSVKSGIGLKIIEYSVITSLLFLTSSIVMFAIVGDLEEAFGLVATKLKVEFYRIYYFVSSLF
jgi:hypothetical protein